MKFDVFFSICQTEVNSFTPSEKIMFQNYFDQVRVADEIGLGIAWLAESHLSSEVQKQNSHPVIPHFKGEVGLNTDILQMAHRTFALTSRIEIGSAIRNILCNGGPLAHAEAVKLFLTLHNLTQGEKRKLHLGFAAGRFDYSNKPYGIKPRNQVEHAAWSVVKHKLFGEAVEIFCRSLRGDVFSSEDIALKKLEAKDFPKLEQWDKLKKLYEEENKTILHQDFIPLAPQWVFEKLAVVPNEAPLELLSLTIGTHDPQTQILANEFLPTKVFNLSITPVKTIEETHERMQKHFHPAGGVWQRDYLPRTVLVFIEGSPSLSVQEQRRRARERAEKTIANYWRAMEGTIDSQKVAQAVENSLCGCPEDIQEQIRQRFHPHDRLMLWFDFNCHDNAFIKESMRCFAEKVIPHINESETHGISLAKPC